MAARFITFEGLDASGKSTQLQRVAHRLESRDIPHRVTQEPGGTSVGEGLRDVFLHRRHDIRDGMVEALVVFASRRQHILEVIQPALEAGKHVLCDRFTDSTLVYQGCGRGVPRETIAQLDRLATGGLVPDRTLLFDLPVEVAQERRNQESRDRLDSQTPEFYERVRQGYLELVEREPQRFRVIDATQEPTVTEPLVFAALADLFDLGEGTS